jgi:hypothetical protein
MGLLGSGAGGIIGGGLGSAIGRKIGGKTGAEIGGGLGKLFGTAGGAFLPFEKGGLVKPKGSKKTQKALLHKGEMVIPAKHVKSIPKSIKNKIKKEGGRNM